MDVVTIGWLTSLDFLLRLMPHGTPFIGVRPGASTWRLQNLLALCQVGPWSSPELVTWRPLAPVQLAGGLLTSFVQSRGTKDAFPYCFADRLAALPTSGMFYLPARLLYLLLYIVRNLCGRQWLVVKTMFDPRGSGQSVDF